MRLHAAPGGETGVTDGAHGGATRSAAEVERLARALRRAVARACPPELASAREDLVQAALVRVLEHEARGEENRVRTASYLWRVAWSAVIDELRRLRRRPTVSLDAMTSGAEERQPDGAPAPEVHPVTEPAPGLGLALRQCLERLAGQRRAAVLLHLHGFTAQEAALTLGRGEKQVQNAVYRGLGDLRRCLGSKGHGP